MLVRLFRRSLTPDCSGHGERHTSSGVRSSSFTLLAVTLLLLSLLVSLAPAEANSFLVSPAASASASTVTVVFTIDSFAYGYIYLILLSHNTSASVPVFMPKTLRNCRPTDSLSGLAIQGNGYDVNRDTVSVTGSASATNVSVSCQVTLAAEYSSSPLSGIMEVFEGPFTQGTTTSTVTMTGSH